MSLDKTPTNIRQVPDKAPIMFPDKKSIEIQAESDFEGILTTCENNHVISKQGNKNTRVPLLASNTAYKDTNDWSSECDELFREMEYKDMEKQVWKPKIEKLINVIQDDPDGWRKLLELYNPDTRPKKREERYIQFKSLDLNTKWNVSEDFFSQGWFGLDQMMINITTPGFKKKGVAIKQDKLEYLEKLWLFSVKDNDKKTKIDLENQKKVEAEEASTRNAYVFMIIVTLICLFLFKSCVDFFTTNSPADSQFMDNCQSIQMKSEKACKETLERNKKFINEMN